MTEQIYIKNLYSLDEVSVYTQSINILIGSQAEGKSLLMKALWFTKSLPLFIGHALVRGNSEIEIKNTIKNTFDKFFNASQLKNCEIKLYQDHELVVSVKKIKTIQIHYHPKISKIIQKYILVVEKIYSTPNDLQNELNDILKSFIKEIFSSFPKLGKLGIYIPASRSIYSILQDNIFQIISNEQSIDPIFPEFASIYRAIKSFHEKEIIHFSHPHTIHSLLKADYKRVNKKDFIKNNKYTTDLLFASSGQQEILPILIILNYISHPKQEDLNLACGVDLYIEEPEAHLFPETQLNLMKYIIQVYNITQKSAKTSTITLTTHTPYLLTIINNLIKLGQIPPTLQTNEDRQYSLQPSEVSACFLQNGIAKSIIDAESSMIQADPIDSVSESIAQQFDQILERMYELH